MLSSLPSTPDTKGTEYTTVTVNNAVTSPAPGELLNDGSFETSGVLSFGTKSTTSIGGWRTSTSMEA
jgi:hypothetical protein